MVYGLLADLVGVLHLAFVVFVVLGGLLVLRWRWVAWVHVPAAVWGGVIEATGRICPLTPLENWLRRAAGGSGYEGSFIEHYVTLIVYPPGLTRDVQWAMATLLGVINGTIYVLIWHRTRKAVPSKSASTLR